MNGSAAMTGFYSQGPRAHQLPILGTRRTYSSQHFPRVTAGHGPGSREGERPGGGGHASEAEILKSQYSGV